MIWTYSINHKEHSLQRYVSSSNSNDLLYNPEDNKQFYPINQSLKKFKRMKSLWNIQAFGYQITFETPTQKYL